MDLLHRLTWACLHWWPRRRARAATTECVVILPTRANLSQPPTTSAEPSRSAAEQAGVLDQDEQDAHAQLLALLGEPTGGCPA
ncbi:hypothetical protein ACPYPG_07025 [Streptomyces sp. FR-108]|uniref:hypothetical protein n=1 Tax=Streptomyces sp. FR-108 TaxID=3416665 RepID=UPI003CEF0149